MDWRLIEAYQVMKDESCAHCGNPVWLCRNEKVMWAVQTDICNADKALDDWHKSKKDSKGNSTIRPGVHPYVTAYVETFDENQERHEDYENLPSRMQFFEKDLTV